MKHFSASLIIFLFLSCSPIEREGDLFVSFWKFMDKNYVFFDLKGVDWDSVFSVYYPRTRNITYEEYIVVFQEIIDLFRDGHLILVSPFGMLIWYGITENHGTNVDFRSLFCVPENLMVNPVDMFADDAYFREPHYLLQLKNDITYITFSTGSLTHKRFDSARFARDIENYSFSNGIIFDLRLSGGGSGRHLSEWVACFFAGTRTIWYQRNKIGAGRNDFSDFIPITANGLNIISQDIPVVVLSGIRAYSAGNFIVGAMKHLPNVTVIGTKTGGGGSARRAALMPEGWILHYPFTPSYDIKRNSLEPYVAPHIEITATDEELEENPHLVFEFAYNYLLNR